MMRAKHVQFSVDLEYVLLSQHLTHIAIILNMEVKSY